MKALCQLSLWNNHRALSYNNNNNNHKSRVIDEGQAYWFNSWLTTRTEKKRNQHKEGQAPTSLRAFWTIHFSGTCENPNSHYFSKAQITPGHNLTELLQGCAWNNNNAAITFITIQSSFCIICVSLDHDSLHNQRESSQFTASRPSALYGRWRQQQPYRIYHHGCLVLRRGLCHGSNCHLLRMLATPAKHSKQQQH